VNFNRIFRRAKKVVDDRGGTDALVEDAKELASVARRKGGVTDKAKAASEAVSDPGAPGAQDDPSPAGAEKDHTRPEAGDERGAARSGEPPKPR
jgi:hypothetical protein